MSADVTKERIRRLLDGRTAPVVQITQDGITVDGEPLPLMLAAAPIEIKVPEGGVGVEVRFSVLSVGPTIVDRRYDHERPTEITVEPRAQARLEEGTAAPGSAS